MAKFNQKTQATPNAVSYEDGAVYTKSPAEEWLNFLFSSYLEDRFYETASKQTERFMALTENMVSIYGAEFVANAAFFARNELGMRSVSQLVAAMLNSMSFDEKRAFFRNYCHRPDDVSEIFAILDIIKGKKSHALVRGFGDYISSLNAYTLGKYKLNRHDYNMYDIINLTHAKSPAIDAYKANVLAAPDTWEVSISATKNETEKGQEWKRLVEENKLGYLALLRNLRNILTTADVDHGWIMEYLCPQITNEASIRKSLVYPYQIYAAYKNMDIYNTAVIAALETAFHTALQNMPVLKGDTLIILDVSGSMSSPMSMHSKITIRETGAVYAACIALTSEHSDIVKFATDAAKFNFNKKDSVFHQIKKLDSESGLGYGTNLSVAYGCVHRKYDRIMLISDMQIMSTDRYYWQNDGITSYEEYCKEYGRTPIYSFDLGNYHTQTSNPNNPDVYLCTSLSEKTLKFISLLENKESIVDYINNNYDYRISH